MSGHPNQPILANEGRGVEGDFALYQRASQPCISGDIFATELTLNHFERNVSARTNNSDMICVDSHSNGYVPLPCCFLIVGKSRFSSIVIKI